MKSLSGRSDGSLCCPLLPGVVWLALSAHRVHSQPRGARKGTFPRNQKQKERKTSSETAIIRHLLNLS
uniref:Uncharacterized protein n=1 Tax=Mus musculus TaxID=10090 RepID=Q3UWK6_MOUSE|nr:unnamed protein product [Mus musculus]